MKKVFFIVLGSVSLALGLAGLFIPVLPTTPFLLLASFFYLHSSKRLYHWLINHRILGAYLYCYQTLHGIPRKTKIGTLAFLWSTLIISMLLISSLLVRIFLVAVGIGVTVHLVTLRTLGYEEMKAVKELYPKKSSV
jgi:hypothetical protein